MAHCPGAVDQRMSKAQSCRSRAYAESQKSLGNGTARGWAKPDPLMNTLVALLSDTITLAKAYSWSSWVGGRLVVVAPDHGTIDPDDAEATRKMSCPPLCAPGIRQSLFDLVWTLRSEKKLFSWLACILFGWVLSTDAAACAWMEISTGG
jgi:hypothetical protein